MKFRMSAAYGEMTEVHPNGHNGVDFAMPEGTPLRSLANGVVEKVADYGADNVGKAVFIKTDSGQTFIYGHMSKFDVKQGQHVSTGDILGYSGNTGHSTGPHLHFAIKDSAGQFIDPTPYSDAIQHMDDKWWSGFFDGPLSTIAKHGETIRDTFVNDTARAIGDGIVVWFVQLGHDTSVFLTTMMPDIGGYATLAAGTLIMITGNARKIATWYMAVMIGAIAWLSFH